MELRRVAHSLKVMAFEAITNPVDETGREGVARLHNLKGELAALHHVEQAMSKGSNAWPSRLSSVTPV